MMPPSVTYHMQEALGTYNPLLPNAYTNTSKNISSR